MSIKMIKNEYCTTLLLDLSLILFCHYHEIDDTPTQEAYHGLNVTPLLHTLTDSKLQTKRIGVKIKEGFNGKGGRY